MRATASYSSGFCAIEENTGTKFVDVTRMTAIPVEVAHLVAGTIDDWEVIQGPSRDAIISAVRNAYNKMRIVANIENCLRGVSRTLQLSLLEEVEDSIKTLDNHDQFASMLLRAPLAETSSIDALAKVCLAEGFAASARVVDQVRELQPQLRRVVDRWLSIPEDVFLPLPGGRQQAWRAAVANDVVLKTIDASNIIDVQQAWTSLAFDTPHPAERMCFARIGKELGTKLFPHYVAEVVEPDDETEKERKVGWSRPLDPRESFERAMKQIDAITKAVSEGYDGRARKFLTELVDAQMTYSGGEDFAVKSICNVAQQCADMFRSDFEYECLQTAIRIKPRDAWTLIQLADHFKRVGRFDDAIKILEDSAKYGDATIARSSLADVYVKMRRFDEAMHLYAQIPGGDLNPAVRGAKADALRHRGLLEEAIVEYEQIIKDGLATHRVYAGLAEIAKRRGNFEEACKLYENLLVDATVDSHSRFIYRMAFAQVLVRKGDFAAAYQNLDEAVQDQPFARQAWALRAAVAGLLGNPNEAVNDLPNLGQTRAFNEWVSEYIRGLLLLMLRRYRDARIALFQNIKDRLLDKDASEIVRLGAAVSYLSTRAGVEDAARLLESIPEIEDAFAETIRVALRYHVAVALQQREEMTRLREQLNSVADSDLRSLITAIDEKHWERAWHLELRSLLRLAA